MLTGSERHSVALGESGATVAAEEGALQERTFTLPFVLVLGYVLVEYGRPQNWIPALGVLRPGVLVLGGAMLALVVSRRAVLGRVGKYVLVFLLALVLSVPYAYNNFTAFAATRDFALLVFGAVIPMMTFVDSTSRLKVLVRFWLAMHVSLALYAITHGGRGIGSFLGDENDLCLAMNMALPFGLFLMFAVRSGRERLAILGSIVFLLLATVSSMSRGGFVGLVAVGAFCWLRMPRRILGTGVLAVLVGAFVVLAPAKYWDEMRTISTADEQGDTGYNRLYLWGIAWRMYLDNPVLGVGPGNFPHQSPFYESDDEQRRGFHVWGKAAHSLYFTLLSETGTVGTLAFVAMIVACWRVRREVRRRCRVLLASQGQAGSRTEDIERLRAMSLAIDAATVAYLVTGAFLTVLYYPHAWLLAAFTVALSRVSEAEAARLAEVGSAAEPAVAEEH